MDFHRVQIVKRIDELHHRDHPAHVMLVGPRAMGKTRIASALVLRHSRSPGLFAGATLVDLRNSPPPSGDTLIARVAEAWRAGLKAEPSGSLSWLADQITSHDPETLFSELKMAAELLRDERKRWLIVLDGCDETLANPDIPRNAWDNLRVLGESGAVKYLTTSRAPLSELCSKEVRLSPFFNLFDPPSPVWVGSLDEADWQQLGREHGSHLDATAIHALRRWTGGIPYLMHTLLRELPSRDVSAGHVDLEAKGLLDRRSEAMRFLWSSYPLETQQDLARLTQGPASPAGWTRDRIRALTLRGLAREEQGALHGCSELMRQVAIELRPGVEDLGRLFGTAEGFVQNMQGVLELRLAQVQGADDDLLEAVRYCVEQGVRSPKKCLVWAREVRNRALDVVWKMEAPEGRIPASWIEHWKFGGVKQDQIGAYINDPRIPSDGGPGCGLLRLAAGRSGLASVLRYTSRATQALIEHMNGLGNVTNHSSSVLTPTLAASFCLAAIELCESLARDLAGAGSPAP